MKIEIINILTWFASRMTELQQFNWSDEFRKSKFENAMKVAQESLKKYINWDELTSEDCDELRFGRWASEEDIKDDLYEIKRRYDEKEISKEEMEEAVAEIKRTVNLRLIPLFLFPIIPIGYKVICIDGEEVTNDGTNLDNDIRCGCVAYGIIPKDIIEQNGK